MRDALDRHPLGALDGLKVQPEVLSYEGPFGVGYMVASLDIIA